MSRFSYNREFNPAMPVYCRRPFIANGRRYVPGDSLDWRKMSISQRKISTMFGAGMLEHVTVKQSLSVGIAAAAVIAASDELDAIEDMKELRAIADAEGAGYKVSKADQRQAIRDNRKESN